ncbi:PLP-dependent cysteine synthase family protein [Paenibacillus endoradicis]|uniref:PLP-dependent cysteine synthase family protein n=1 Tax=Paenibacillus endoradicis TaxID=2972487 RepID=UPI0021592407|nr:cysteine synthase family protein [Paenibacillus endoradicis]MCR8656820.1 cysteine synthase family protein [Paenibacillus endoradicis]
MTEQKLIIQSIGQTPLIRLNNINIALQERGVQVLAKAEHLNPSGSVKDRAAKAMINSGIRTGELIKGKSIIDGTSGNTGIAYAMIGAALGYQVTLCLPANANQERKQILRAYGATIIESDPLEGSDGAQLMAKQIAEEHPERYFYPDQYNNQENWLIHYHTTAIEIWEQSNKCVTHFVAGMGTSGTFIGTSRKLKELNPSLQAIAMQPDSPIHGLEGMKHMDTTLKPGIYDADLADDVIEIDTDDAIDTSLRLARNEGLFVGISAGGNVKAALKVAETAPSGSVIVTILCDSGMRYLSEDIWERG